MRSDRLHKTRWRGLSAAPAVALRPARPNDRRVSPMTQPGLPQGIRLRAPALVMRLARLGALQPSRLSFDRQLLRRIAAERWTVTRSIWSLDAAGKGHAVYTVSTGARRYALLAVADGGLRSGFALCDGTPDADDIARLRAALLRAEPGRASERELCLTHATREGALWDHVLHCLAAGGQPDTARLTTGALMRAAPVLASGKMGTADRDLIAHRAEMHAPFQAELLTLWLMRRFARDLVEHLAEGPGGAQAARLTPRRRRRLASACPPGCRLRPFR